MKQIFIFALAIVAIVTVVGIISTVHAEDVQQAAVEESKDKVKAQAQVIGESSPPPRKVVKVTLVIEDGWHVNANPATLESFIPTSVDVQTNPPSRLQVSYPKGKKLDTVLGPIDVFEGTVDIVATVESEKLIDDSKMRVLLQVQACKADICYPPSKIVLNVTH